MNKHDAPEFAKVLASLGELYNQSITKNISDMYWGVLKGFELNDIKHAVFRHIQNPDVGQFMPKPADIIRGITGSTQNLAKQAWSKVDFAIRSIGSYSTVVFDDPIIHSVIRDLGGWIRISRKNNHELGFTAHDFEKRYIGYLNSPPRNYISSLTGLVDLNNSANFHSSKKQVRFIGDESKAKQVMLTGQSPGLKTQSLTFNQSSISNHKEVSTHV